MNKYEEFFGKRVVVNTRNGKPIRGLFDSEVSPQDNDGEWMMLVEGDDGNSYGFTENEIINVRSI